MRPFHSEWHLYMHTLHHQHMHGIGNVTVSSYAGGFKQTSFRAMCSDEAFKPQRKATIETSDEANEFIHEACAFIRVFPCLHPQHVIHNWFYS